MPIKCKPCGERFRIITASHLKYKHNGMTTTEYQEMFPDALFKAPEVKKRTNAKPIEYTITCLNCSKTKTFEKARPTSKERQFCSNSCSSTYHNLIRWSDPVFPQRMLVINKESHNTPEYHKEASKRAEEQWANPDIRAKRVQGSIEAWTKEKKREQSKRSSGQNNPMWKGGLETIVCLNCKQEFEAPPSSNRKFCLLKCRNEYWQKHPSKTPNWQGGISTDSYPHGFNGDYKEQIHHHDNFTCQLCNLSREEQLQKYGRNFSTHHIDYNKDNLSPKNLISLCDSCHSKTHHNRPYWQAFLETKIKAIYLEIKVSTRTSEQLTLF